MYCIVLLYLLSYLVHVVKGVIYYKYWNIYVLIVEGNKDFTNNQYSLLYVYPS